MSMSPYILPASRNRRVRSLPAFMMRSAAHAAINGSDVTLHLTAPNPGKFAVKMFQDLRGDGRLHRNFLGIPDEPYAFSNNATANFGPPDFNSAAFDVGAVGAAQTIRLR
jgi:uncharacterized protein (DUF2141 family)